MVATMNEPESDSLQIPFLDQTSDKVKRYLGYYVVGVAAWRFGRSIEKQVRDKMSHTVSVGSEDELYDDVMAWLYDSIPSKDKRSLAARTKKTYGNDPGVVSDEPDGTSTRKLRLYYDGARVHTVVVNGHKIRVSVNKERVDKIWMQQVEFTCSNTDARDALLEHMRLLVENKTETKPRFYMGTRWGDWNRKGDVPARDIDSVVLGGDAKEVLLKEIKFFLDHRTDYEELGIPWHRGIMLHGTAGSGKTTLVKALASHFNLDLYFVSLSDLDSDTRLLNMMFNISPRSIFLLEDIDVVYGMKERDDSEGGVTTAGILNALDGIGTPSGVVCILTTNNLDTIDTAILRAGRIDSMVELTHLDQDQFERLCLHLTGEVPIPAIQIHDHKITPADITGVVKNYIGDRQGQHKALREFVMSQINLQNT